MATVSELIETAKTKLAVVLAADPATYVDYRIGDKAVKKSQYVAHLLETLKKLTEIDAAEADLEFVQFDYDFDEMGIDGTQKTVL